MIDPADIAFAIERAILILGLGIAPKRHDAAIAKLKSAYLACLEEKPPR